MPNSLGISDADYDMLGFYASLAGQTPEQYAGTLANQGPVTQAPTNAWNANLNASITPAAPTWLDRNETWLNSGYATNQGTINNLGSDAQQLSQANALTLNNLMAQIGAQRAADDQYVSQSQALTNQLAASGQAANQFDWNALNNYQATLGGYNQGIGNLLGGLGGAYQSMATPLQSTLSYNPITSQAAQAYADPASIAAQNNALGFLGGAMNGSLDYQSQAAQAYASSQSMQQQQAAYDRLDAIANGALNYQSDAGEVYASQADIGNQQNAANMLQMYANGFGDVDPNSIEGYWELGNAARGGLDVDPYSVDGMKELWNAQFGSMDLDPNSIAGMTDLYGVFKGSQDVTPGMLDPEAYAAQKEALSKYRGLTDPTVTAAEEFIYRQAQLRQEQDENAIRGAVMNDLRQRGRSGSAQELVQAAVGGRQTSQNRLLADLGAQAQAVQRSMDALAGYGNLSSVMTGQANDIAQQNAANRINALGAYTGLAGNVEQSNYDRRYNALSQYADTSANIEQNNKTRQLGALEYYTGLGADIASTNSNRRLTAQSAASDAYARLREQGFDEAYARAAARDTAKQFNANMQFQGSTQAYNAASDMRNQSFNEAYSRGVAADNASANNQSTRLSAGVNYGNLATNMRNSSFNEAYMRGSAADQTAQYNETNRIGIQKYNQDYAQQERDSAWNRALGLTNSGLQGAQIMSSNTTNAFDAGRITNESAYNRNRDAISSQDTTNLRQNQATTRQTELGMNLGGLQTQANNQWFNNQQMLAGLNMQNQNALTSGYLNLNSQRAGGDAASSAAALAIEETRRQAEHDNSFRFGLGGDRGLLGGNLIPGII